MAHVIRLPVDRTAKAARSTASSAITAASTVGWLASWDVDEWGRDATLVDAAARLAHLRWATTIGGYQRIPKRGGAIVVVNSRRFALTPWFVAIALGHQVDRPVRFVGRS